HLPAYHARNVAQGESQCRGLRRRFHRALAALVAVLRGCPVGVRSCLFALWLAGRRNLVVLSATHRASPSCTQRLTLPSRGRLTAGFAVCKPPLMSNVRPHERNNPHRKEPYEE